MFSLFGLRAFPCLYHKKTRISQSINFAEYSGFLRKHFLKDRFFRVSRRNGVAHVVWVLVELNDLESVSKSWQIRTSVIRVDHCQGVRF